MRTPRLRLLPLLAVALVAAARGTAAGEAPLAERRVLVELGGRATRLDYDEYGPGGDFLDGETGIVPGLEGAAQVRLGPVALRATAAVAGATVRYAGHTQSSNVQLNGLPIRGTSGAHLAGAGLELALSVPRVRGLAVVAGAGRRRWDRTIHDTTAVPPGGTTLRVVGLREVYRWDVLTAGLRATLLARDRFVWEVDGAVLRTRRPAITVTWNGRDVKLPLGERMGWSAGSTLRAALGPVLVARLGFALERWEFGESDVDGRTRLQEPRSTSRTATWSLGLGAAF